MLSNFWHRSVDKTVVARDASGQWKCLNPPRWRFPDCFKRRSAAISLRSFASSPSFCGPMPSPCKPFEELQNRFCSTGARLKSKLTTRQSPRILHSFLRPTLHSWSRQGQLRCAKVDGYSYIRISHASNSIFLFFLTGSFNEDVVDDTASVLLLLHCFV